MKVKLRSKLGRPFWRFGARLMPDAWTEMELTEQQLRSIEAQCRLPVAEGGALELEFLDVEDEPAESTRQPKDRGEPQPASTKVEDEPMEPTRHPKDRAEPQQPSTKEASKPTGSLPKDAQRGR